MPRRQPGRRGHGRGFSATATGAAARNMRAYIRKYVRKNVGSENPAPNIVFAGDDGDLMKNVINVLDFNVANLIAAGEVVERPASAIKELVENSIDAGAKNITVEIQNGGVSLMRVTDDGCGMSRGDAAMCVKRHATSKLKTGADLNTVMTFGFRGEALAAISAVTNLRIYTKQRGADCGTFVECRDGKVMTVEDIGCAVGTTVIAEELFAKVPARRKFLKKDSSETMAVTAAVEKLALSHPEVSVGLICDGKLRFRTAGDKKLANAVYAVMGRDVARRLISVHDMQNSIGVDGFIGSPELAKKTRHSEIFFVNGRYIRSAVTASAVEEAFLSYIPSGKFPVCILYITMHPVFVDVNVHPSKLEVKFSSDREVFDAVYSAVRGALVYNIDRPKYGIGKDGISADELMTAFAPMPDRTERSAGSGRIPRNMLDIEYEEPGTPERQAGGEHVSPDADAAQKLHDGRTGRGAGEMSELPDTDRDRPVNSVRNFGKAQPADLGGQYIGAYTDGKTGVYGGENGTFRERGGSPGGLRPDTGAGETVPPYGESDGVPNGMRSGIPNGEENSRQAAAGSADISGSGSAVQAEAAAGGDASGFSGGISGMRIPETDGFPGSSGKAAPYGSGVNMSGSSGIGIETGSSGTGSEGAPGISEGRFSDGGTEAAYATGVPDVSGDTDKASSQGEIKPPDYRMIGVAANAYVFVELDDSVLVIDKHAAHERILFERMRENMGKGGSFPQILMLPEKIELSYDELQAAEDYRGEILKTGYDYEIDQESRTATVTQIPGGVEHAAAADMFTEILARLSDGGEGAELSRNGIFERALYQASCKAAVKAGYSDDMSHIKWICEQVLSNPKIRYCPHGRPVAFEMTKRDIEHRFKRS